MNNESPFATAVAATIRLHELIRCGRGDSDEADAARDAGSDVWYQLTEDEQALVNELSEDLHYLAPRKFVKRLRASQREVYRRLIIDLHPDATDKNWRRLRERVHELAPHLPFPPVYYGLAKSWEWRGYPKCAIPFFGQLATEAGSAKRDEISLLPIGMFVRSRSWADVVELSSRLLSHASNPEVRIYAAIYLVSSALNSAAPLHESAEILARELRSLTDPALQFPRAALSALVLLASIQKSAQDPLWEDTRDQALRALRALSPAFRWKLGSAYPWYRDADALISTISELGDSGKLRTMLLDSLASSMPEFELPEAI